MVMGTIWVQNIYLRLDTVVLLPNFEIAFAHISVKGSPIAVFYVKDTNYFCIKLTTLANDL